MSYLIEELTNFKDWDLQVGRNMVVIREDKEIISKWQHLLTLAKKFITRFLTVFLMAVDVLISSFW